MMYMNYQNPYMQTFPYSWNQPQAQKMEIIKVSGENGARSMTMAPNSSALLLDTTAPIVWLVQTDGAGYQTVTPYKISEYKQPEPIDMTELEARIARLEEAIRNDKSNLEKFECRADRKQSAPADDIDQADYSRNEPKPDVSGYAYV